MDRIPGIGQLTRTLAGPVVVTIGNFDGVHLGHRQIFEQVVHKAREGRGTSVAYTFRPHPQVALRPGSRLPMLSTYDERAELIGACGIDVLIEEPFSREVSTTSPQSFFTDVILRRLSAAEVIVGYDFAFGKGREGSLEVLWELCRSAGVTLTVVPPHKIGTEVVSSSRIRQHLLAGQVSDAARLLGRGFFYRGTVVRGSQRGRTIGFPTANLRLEDKLALPYGVYATKAVLDDGREFASVTNVGVRPTFEAAVVGSELPALIETHLLDTTIDLYGRTLEVRFFERIREERKFPGLDALKAQIAQDAQRARGLLTGKKG